MSARKFTGSYEHSLDDKHRLVIPRVLRDRLSADEETHLVPGNDHCLELLPGEVFTRRYEQKLAAAEQGDQRNRAVLRMFTAFAEPLVFDRTGRIPVHAKLREYARLDGVCQVNGAGEWIEIWSEAGWRDQMGIGADALGGGNDETGDLSGSAVDSAEAGTA